MMTATTTIPTAETPAEKQITVDVPADRVAEFYGWYARFLASEGGPRRRRGGPRGRRHHGHGPHGHGCRHGHHGHHEDEHGTHEAPVAPEQSRHDG